MKKAMKTSVLLLSMFAFMLGKEVKLIIVYLKKIFHYQATWNFLHWSVNSSRTIFSGISNTSCCQVSETLWTAACPVPLSMGFSKQEYWGGLPCLHPGDLPNPGIEPTSLSSPAVADGFCRTVPPGTQAELGSSLQSYHPCFLWRFSQHQNWQYTCSAQ